MDEFDRVVSQPGLRELIEIARAHILEYEEANAWQRLSDNLTSLRKEIPHPHNPPDYGWRE